MNPGLVLVQPRKTCPFITERLLMGRKESNQTNKQKPATPRSPVEHSATSLLKWSVELNCFSKPIFEIAGLEAIKLSKLSTKLTMLINVEMPTIILTFMSMINTTSKRHKV